MNRWCLALLVGLGVARAGAQEPVLKDGERTLGFERSITKVVGTHYLLVLPEGYSASTSRWPLLVFLHGSGERGNELGKVKNNWPRIIDQCPDFPFIVAAPQCPEDDEWDEDVPIALVNDVIERARVDGDRIYVTGLSMGGHGTWAVACAFPDRFAAIAPICGGGSTSLASRLVRVPVWAFHGENDAVVPLEATREMVDAVNAAGGSAKLTVYPGVGHDSWVNAYNDPALFRWLLEHKRGGESAELEPGAKEFLDRWQAACDYQRSNQEPPLMTPKRGPAPPFVMRRANPAGTNIEEVVTWTVPPKSPWKISPLGQKLSLPPGGGGVLEFEIRFDGTGKDIYPLPTRYGYIKVGRHEMLKSAKPLALDDRFYLAHALTAECAGFTNPPQVDGKLDDPAWASCQVLTGFRQLDGLTESAYPTEVRIGYDASSLYLGFLCKQTNLEQLVLSHGQRDGNLWEDDSVEVFLDHRLDRKNYFHLIVNADGYVFDEIVRDRSWDSTFEVKTGREEGAWTLEMAVPWASLGITHPGPGIRMGLELVRTKAGTPFEMSQWAPTLGENHTPSRFGVLEFQ